MYVVVDVVGVVVVLCDVLVLRKALWNVVGILKWENLVFMHCSELKLGITLSFLGLKLWGLLFWKACFMPYHFDVLSFCICSAEKL